MVVSSGQSNPQSQNNTQLQQQGPQQQKVVNQQPNANNANRASPGSNDENMQRAFKALGLMPGSGGLIQQLHTPAGVRQQGPQIRPVAPGADGQQLRPPTPVGQGATGQVLYMIWL